MTLKQELLREHSKANAEYLANKIGADQEAFDELVELFLGNEYRVTQRAAWVFRLCLDNHPELLDKHMESVILNLKNPVQDAVKRNTVRILQFTDIPDELLGISAEICFDLLNGSEPVAVKAFSMTVLFNIAKSYPELKEELKISIEDQLPYGSAGFKSRGNRILKALESL